MRRLLALALVLCAGCAAEGGENLLADSLFGDIRSLFAGRPSSSTLPTPPAGYGNPNSSAAAGAAN